MFLKWWEFFDWIIFHHINIIIIQHASSMFVNKFFLCLFFICLIWRNSIIEMFFWFMTLQFHIDQYKKKPNVVIFQIIFSNDKKNNEIWIDFALQKKNLLTKKRRVKKWVSKIQTQRKHNTSKNHIWIKKFELLLKKYKKNPIFRM